MRAVKAYGEMEIELHSCLTSVLGGGERPALSSGRFALGKGPFSVPRCPLHSWVPEPAAEQLNGLL